ncbi:MAG: LysR family transcriptional regulator [Marinovum algicola]|nr:MULTISPECIES: LysR family transcriptional regulator [Marinovum]MDD9738947.1 LysR family transcriptional regulator [Marinovum sp. SP66]MDD9745826.1 LysR family transcriptional regulator [Marinovum sp. PR37]
MRPRLLRQFLAICRHGTMSGAARELGIAQPALSKQMSQLEHELDAQLFQRHSRGVTLTRAGEKLRQEAAELIRRMEAIRQAIHTEAEDVTGKVVVAVISSLAPTLATELYPRLEQEYPGISLHIVDFPSERAGQALLNEEADLAVMPNAATEFPQLRSRPLFEESFHFLTKATPRAPARTIRLSEAAEHPLVLPFRSHDLRRRIEEAAGSIGVTLNVKYQTGSINVIDAMVERGMVASIVPMTHWLDRIASGQVSARLVTEPGVSRVHSLCHRPVRDLAPATKVVHDVIMTEVQSLVAAGKLSGKPVRA